MSTSEAISQLPVGTPKGSDLTPATDVTDLTESSTGTTKSYVRWAELNFYLNAQDVSTLQAVDVATTANLAATYNNGTVGINATLINSSTLALLTIDGILLTFYDLVLVKNQTTSYQNGIYIVSNPGSLTTNWVLTRASYYDTPAQIIQFQVMLVNQGIANSGILYQETAAGPFTIGVSPITFGQYSGSAGIVLPVSLGQGGTGASLTASVGGIFYSTASEGAILAGTATQNLPLLSGASAAPVWGNYGIALGGALTTGAAVTYSGAYTFTGTLTGNTSVTFPTSGTLATTGSFPSLPVSLANGGTGADLTASNGGIFFSTATTGSILSGTATAGQVLQSGASTTPAWSTPTYPSASGSTGQILRSDGTNNVYTTATYPGTTTINQLLYSSSGNVIGGLATAASAVLTTVSSVPTWASDLSVALGGTGAATFTAYSVICAGTTATGAFQNVSGVGLSGQALVSNGASALPTWQNVSGSGTINSGTVNELAYYTGSGTTVGPISTANNGVLVTNGSGVPSISTTLPSGLSATSMTMVTPTLGAATATSITFSPTTGGIVGTTTNDSAGAGKVGQYVSSNVLAGSAVNLSNTTPADITSISLSAGDWDVTGNILFIASVTGSSTYQLWANTVSATAPDESLQNTILETGSFTSGSGTNIPPLRVSAAAPVTVYLSAIASFSGTASGCGGIYARRVR